MAATKFFGDSMTLTVETAGDSNAVPVGVLQNVEITVQADHTELYGADTILREDVKKSNLSVTVNAGVASIDYDAFHQQWLSGSDTSTDASQTPTDTNDVALFDITGTITDTSGTTKQAQVTDVYFEELPVYSAEQGEYIEWDLSGTGKTIDITDPA